MIRTDREQKIVEENNKKKCKYRLSIKVKKWTQSNMITNYIIIYEECK